MLVLDNDWQVVDNLESITYFVKTAQDTWDAGTSIPNVLRRARTKEFSTLDKQLSSQEVVFHVWANQIAQVPKLNDRIVDSDTFAYVVKDVDVHTLYTRYKLTCVRSGG